MCNALGPAAPQDVVTSLLDVRGDGGRRSTVAAGNESTRKHVYRPSIGEGFGFTPSS
jgi:hypothetical protein